MQILHTIVMTFGVCSEGRHFEWCFYSIWLESKVWDKAYHLGPLLRRTWSNKTILILSGMGISFSSLFASFTALAGWKEKDVRILMLGLDSAGKTTILYRMQVCGIPFKFNSTLISRLV